MLSFFPALAAIGLALAFVVLWSRWRVAARAEYIRGYTFPTGLFSKLKKKHPNLSPKDCQLVAQALRQFFLAYLKSGRRFVSMPSQVADDLWHELILYTKAYDQFCRHAFGRFLHHTPAVVLGPRKDSNAGLRRCWWFSCQEEKIDPRRPTRLPLLFALDSKLNVEGGFRYAPDCRGFQQHQGGKDAGAVHCGGDFSSPGVDGSTDGFGDTAGDGAGDGGDGGGCGGGCGGD